ncbi:GNAT family N-acetyltransferase [Roseibium litorale]|uniref:GNAT family N-acetyltransferase n=1 Tax=Roseibium litorale TaxID=2803841 RepID=A0ABR9CQ48_9HYPH|nr:GNAT family N-acetyltransferase [Roseibium litorale]MBD8892981.1 GNAT family N-acetyltransferase [Roseibium litorale]
MRANFELILAGPAHGRILRALADEALAEDAASFAKEEADAFNRLLVDAGAGRIYLLTVSGEPAGFVIVLYRHSVRPAGRVAVISDFYLRRGHRGRPIARRALRDVLLDLDAFGIAGVDALAHPGSELARLLEMEGFQVEGGCLYRCCLQDFDPMP